MRVYRVENPNKRGPFVEGFAFGLPEKRREKWFNHTNAFEPLNKEVPGFDYCEHRDYLSGVESLEKVRDWFGPFANELERAGFDLHIYEADSEWVIKGKTQVVFLPLAAKLQGVVNWREIAPEGV